MGLVTNLFQGYSNLLIGAKTKEEKSRIKICEACPFFIPNTNFWCGKCPCHMKAKVKAPRAKCKIGKW